MPKIVDGDARRELIANAMWRIVVQGGMRQATIRAVAAESGLSVGAVQHYFKTQSDLVQFAMDSVVKRVRERIAAQNAPIEGDAVEVVAHVLLQLVPLDEERLAESRIWLAFLEASLMDECFTPAREEVESLIADVPRGCLEYLDREGLLREGLDVRREAQRLTALLDGLTVRLVGGLTPEKVHLAQEMIEGEVRRLVVQSPSRA